MVIMLLILLTFSFNYILILNTVRMKQMLGTLVGLKTTAGQRTMSGQDGQWSGQTFGLPVILTEHIVHKRPEKVHFYPVTFPENKNKCDVTRDDSQRRFLAQHSVATLLQHCYDIVSNGYNIVPILQGCVVLTIVAANRPV